MTRRRVGWITGSVVFAALAALPGAVMVARAASGADREVGEGGGTLTLVLGAGLVAAACGLFASGVARSGRGRRTALVAAVAAYLTFGVAVWWQSIRSPRAPGEDPVEYVLELAAAFVATGTAFALAASVVAWWVARHAVGRDAAERALALDTTGLRGPWHDWGMAMRAELASIDEPRHRAWFARSAALAAVRHGAGRWPGVLAVAAGATAAAVVYAAARVSFDRPRDQGIVGEPLMGVVLLVLVVTVAAGTLIGRSFRAGLQTAVLA